MGIQTTFKKPGVRLRAVLLEAVAATDPGVWVKTEGYERFSVHVIISNTATAQLRISNEEAPAGDGIKYGADISASALVEVKVPVRWMKLMVSSHTSGTVDGLLEAA